MPEVLVFYQTLPVWQVGLLLFPLGAIIGSFSSVVIRRTPMGRSRCVKCHHQLRAPDLVPVLSFIWQRGRCRYCHQRISWRYPALELGCGLATAVGGALGGWLIGFGILGLWIGGATLVKHLPQGEAGFSLVETLVAVGLLVSLAIPMIDLGANWRAGTAFQRQIAVSLASSKLEEMGDEAYRTYSGTWPGNGSDQVPVGRYLFNRSWVVSDAPMPADFPSEAATLKQAVVTVTCTNCGRTMRAVRVVTLLAKL